MDTKEMEKRITDLENVIKSLTNNTTIPLEFSNAMEARIGLNINTSTVTLASETQAVNESGSASYNVPKLMTGLIRITKNGRNYDIPYY